MKTFRFNLHKFHASIALASELRVTLYIKIYHPGQSANKYSLIVRSASYDWLREQVNPSAKSKPAVVY